MVLDSGVLAALSVGFLLGLKHATDADHVVAVSTIAGEYGNAWRGIWVGVSWGLGHTTPLLAVGLLILLLKEAVLERYEAIAPVLEFGVGVMLVVLGAQVFFNLRRGRLHVHAHEHSGTDHVHIHTTHRAGAEPREASGHVFFRPGPPMFRLKSYLIGAVHGLAGSAAVMLVLLPQIGSVWAGIGYLVVFGIGTMISMAMITVMLGVPFAVGGRFRGLDRVVARVAGAASLLFGFGLMADLALGTALMPF
ncbi:MAG: urease accessory protein [Chloroflexi bacterium]|nr:urease accessory protein [Chloroflexota bacterium]